MRGAAGRTDPPGHRDDADGHGGEGGERGEAAEGEADEDKNEKKPLPRWKKVLYAAIAAAVLIVVAVAGVLYWMLQRYRQGLADYHQVLTAQRSLLGAEQQLADSTATVGTNLVALYKALGGGWETRFPDAPSGPPPPTRTASAAAR